ncbi:hypothetical protein ISS07_05880 [Candidatus Woesearchaeota archaeon]|nr:hypothetical protein [Candidatus Woesearchaeota archaeon]
MVKVTHCTGSSCISKNIKNRTSFILTNNQGSYTHFSDKPRSKYQGFFYFDNFKMFKTIENISIVGSGNLTEIKNNFFNIERAYPKIKETFSMFNSHNSLAYELDKENNIDIALDVKESYDSREWGRSYKISKEKNVVVIEFTKETNYREDNVHGKKEYQIYLAIKSNKKEYKEISNWKERTYELDQERNSLPYTRHVFGALRLNGNKFVFSVSKNKKKAIEECQSIYNNLKSLKNKQKQYFQDEIIKKNKKIISKIKNKEKKFSIISAMNSLDNLTISMDKEKYILAGLPWFFQNWARDELISLKGLMQMNKFSDAKKIMDRDLKNVKEDGTILNNNLGGIKSADSIGWMFKRIQDYSLSGNFKDKNKLKKIVDVLIKHHTVNHLEPTNSKETWMDSIPREGARIEIQALRLKIYEVLHSLTKNKTYQALEESSRKNVLEKFWNGKYLNDGLEDKTIRPNIFVSYYIYPKLLTKKDWEICFENSLQSSYLVWGGISTIDKKNQLFHKNHSGEIPDSYHNGDSWFWINNLAAMCLHDNNQTKFKKYITKILEASCQELLWSGAIGHHSELSSASNLKSEGCLMQAWSSAMLIELINKIYN